MRNKVLNRKVRKTVEGVFEYVHSNGLPVDERRSDYDFPMVLVEEVAKAQDLEESFVSDVLFWITDDAYELIPLAREYKNGTWDLDNWVFDMVSDL
jgi:hypothetical protein